MLYVTKGTEASPLKLFSRAKNAINSIYHEFYSFIDEIYVFLDCKSTWASFFIFKNTQK